MRERVISGLIMPRGMELVKFHGKAVPIPKQEDGELVESGAIFTRSQIEFLGKVDRQRRKRQEEINNYNLRPLYDI